MTDQGDFPTGARVRFNELGASRSPRMSKHFGTVVRSSGSGVQVILDGSQTINKIHRSPQVVAGDVTTAKHAVFTRTRPTARPHLEPSKDLPDETLIENVRLSTRIAKALLSGIRTIGEIRETSDAGLIRFPNVGKASVKWLRDNIE